MDRRQFVEWSIGSEDWRQMASGKAHEKVESTCYRGYEHLGNKGIHNT